MTDGVEITVVCMDCGTQWGTDADVPVIGAVTCSVCGQARSINVSVRPAQVEVKPLG